MRSFLREPLVQFFLIGVVVFLAHAFWSARISQGDRALVVSTAEIERLAGVWTQQAGRPPSEEDMAGIINSPVRE